MLLDVCLNLFQRNFFRMLRRYNDRVHPFGFAVDIFNRNLGFTVRPEVTQRAVLPHFGKAASNTVRQRNRKRHELRRFIRSKTKHQPLVTGADIFRFLIDLGRIPAFQSGVYALGNVCGLLIKRGEDRASIEIEPIFSTGIANLLHRFANNSRNIDIFGFGADLPDNEH
ncbi:hypothetical protein DJ90_6224 [Paenibacillus macerans]|uniref:Uncharacterized protein n=1 Tax=Paenibacillus macerans TaxID=44252 RepID=A0A090XUE4_PAEMA|nr:hypothetical protein DJ90_6224 [Paenibacillus macerans]